MKVGGSEEERDRRPFEVIYKFTEGFCLHDLILLRTFCKVQYLLYLTSKKLLFRKDVSLVAMLPLLGFGGTTFFSRFSPSSHSSLSGKAFSAVFSLKINVNGPLLFSFPLIRWPHPLSCLAITYKWQLPTLQCTAWPCPRSTWPIHTPSAKTLMFITCAQGAQWAVPDWQRQLAGTTRREEACVQQRGRTGKSHWSSQVCNS